MRNQRHKHPHAERPRVSRGKNHRDLLGAAEFHVYEPPNKDELKVARVYVNFGVESGVMLDGNLIRLANRRRLPTVAGDFVYTDGKVVEGILPRGKVLARFADEGGVRLIASNLDQVGLVCSASLPPMQEGLIDRYFVYCRIVDLPLFVVLNKMDEPSPGIVERLAPYQSAGVDVYCVSALSGVGMKMLTRRLERGVTVLSGLSGVGKSSLINTLLEEELPTQEVNTTTKRGRHTTTAGEAFEFGNTLLIDSPGIRKFGFIGVPKSMIIRGFPELLAHTGHCRFEDCVHDAEKGCGVRAAVNEGLVDERRYEAYVDLLHTIGDDSNGRASD